MIKKNKKLLKIRINKNYTRYKKNNNLIKRL